jgi:purine-binding chemotaxis protein CheW
MTLVLLFNLAGEVYGLGVASIQEIVENPVCHYVPRATGALRSAINFHGQVLPVIDLPRLLGIDGTERDNRLVVLAPTCHSLALVVSKVGRIVALDLALTQLPSVDVRSPAVRGVVTHEETTINLLDTDELIYQLKQIITE